MKKLLIFCIACAFLVLTSIAIIYGGGEDIGGVKAGVSDTAYNATSWNGVINIAPSKNAVRDKLESIIVGGGLIDDGVFPTSWDADTTHTASRNALYDYLHLIDTDDDGDIDTIDATLWATKQGLDTDLTTLATPTAWRMFYSDAADPFVQQITLGADGTFLESNGASAAPAFRTLVDGDIPDTITITNISQVADITASATELNYVDGVTSAIQTQIDAQEAELDDSAGLLAALDDETGTGVAVFNIAPVFVTSFGIGSAILDETELEILDGATLNTTELNYLDGATGVEGTGDTVRNNSPQLITPDIGAATGDSLTLDAAANPSWVWRDSDGADTDKTAGDEGAGFSTTTSGAEISDWHVGHLGSGTAGTHYTHLFWDGSDSHLYMGVLANYTGANPSVAPLDVGTYESLVWDFDYAEDTVGVSSPVSGTTTIDHTTLKRIGTGALAGAVIITTADARALTAAELSGGVVLVTTASEVSLPDVCDSATGANVLIVQRDASEKIEIGVTDTSDDMILDGTALGANQEIDSPGGAGDAYAYICMVCVATNTWANFGRRGTFVDGGAAD